MPGAAWISVGTAHANVTTDKPAISARRLIARSPSAHIALHPSDNVAKLFDFSISNCAKFPAFVTRFETFSAAFKRSGIAGTFEGGIEA
jgi:hypothetical protein